MSSITGIRQSPPPTSDPAPPSSMNDAILERIRATAAQPLSSRMLFEIERLAQIARSILALSADPQTKIPLPGNGTMTTNPYVYSGSSPSIGINPDMIDLPPMIDQDPGPLAPSTKAETFGASFVRELISAVGPKPPSVREQLEAIEIAQRQRMPKLAAKLKKQLESSVELPTNGLANGVKAGIKGGVRAIKVR